MTEPQRCQARARSGQPCRAWAVRGTEPPRCAAHRHPPLAATEADTRDRGAPPRPLLPEFFPPDPAAVTIDGAIAGLADKMRRLDAIIASHDEVRGPAWPPDAALIRMFSLYTLACSRLSRLLRDRRALSNEAADSLAGAVAQVLDELGTEWGIEL